MSNSPTAPTSQKRPLEEPSSPGPETQHGSKRQAVNKSQTDEDREIPQNGYELIKIEQTPSLPPSPAVEASSTVQVLTEESDYKESLATQSDKDAAPRQEELQPIQSTNAQSGHSHQNRRNGNYKNTHGNHNGTNNNQRDDDATAIHVRAIIATQEAATIIGKGGENVTHIRKTSQAKCTVSEYSRGATERILTVSGNVENVAKAFGLIVRTLNGEPLEEPSTPDSKTYPLQILIPHVLVGSIIGKSGVRIKEIQEASTAKLNVSDQCMPQSSERKLVVMGVADAVHIATYYVAKTLYEQLVNFGGPSASAYASRAGEPVNLRNNTLQVVPYVPMSAGGHWGQPDNFRRQTEQAGAYRGMQSPTAGYQSGHPAVGQYGPTTPLGSVSYNRAGTRQPQFSQPQQQPQGAAPQGPHPPQHAGAENDGNALTQQMYIPNDMVGAIIGKGGSKINEIRKLSGSMIKINEPQDDNNERLVTITGSDYSNRLALYMLYARLENEKHRA